MPTLSTPQEGSAATPGGNANHRLGRRRALPSGRAATGALLITVALVGTFALARGADARPTTTFVVATRAIAPGDRFDAGSLGTVAIELPEQQASRAFVGIDELRDTVALMAIEPGEIVQRSVVRDADTDPEIVAQITLSLDKARALGGRLQTGERVTVLATYGTGESASTLVLARTATVIGTDANKNGVGSSGAVLVTLGLPHADSVVAVAHAAEIGTITLARTDATAPDDQGDDISRYSTPDGDASGGASSSAASSGARSSTTPSATASAPGATGDGATP